MNKDKWHLIILPEDDATRQIAVGLSDSRDGLNAVRVLKECRGWTRTVEALDKQNLQKNSERRVLLVIDFDKAEGRIDYIRQISTQAKAFPERVFVIGSKIEAENLKRNFSLSLYKIGLKLGQDCSAWDDPLLVACKDEICRLKKDISENFPG